MTDNITILGDQPKKGDLDAILKRGEEYLRQRAIDEKREALGMPVVQPAPKPQKDVRGDLYFEFYEGDFHTARKALERDKLEIASFEEMAMFRLRHGKASRISEDGAWVEEGIVCLPSSGAYITRRSPVICGLEYDGYTHTQKSQVQDLLKDSCKIPKRTEALLVPASRLADEEFTAFLFGSQAKDYGDFLKDGGVSTIRFQSPEYIRPFVTQIYFGSFWAHDIGSWPLYDAGGRLIGVKSLGGKSR